MTAMKLLNGPCDPRAVDMLVTAEAETVSIRPIPFECRDIYKVVDRFVDDGTVTAATGTYWYTEGPRKQIDAYRRALARLGTSRAFAVKRTKVKP